MSQHWEHITLIVCRISLNQLRTRIKHKATMDDYWEGLDANSISRATRSEANERWNGLLSKFLEGERRYITEESDSEVKILAIDLDSIYEAIGKFWVSRAKAGL